MARSVWAKLFHNLRASCETQWLKEGPRANLVANWIGHSVKVQNLNYVQHTEEDIVAFNNMPALQNRSRCASDDVRTDGKRRKTAENTPHSSPAKTLKSSVFAGETHSKEYPEQDSNLQPAA